MRRAAVVRVVPRLLVLAVLWMALIPAVSGADEPPPPSDAEVNKFIAVWGAIAEDPANAPQVCGLTSGDSESGEWDSARIGRKLDASASFGPALRRAGISGARFAEVTLQVFGGLLGLAYADELDATARERGRPATNRQKVIQDSAEARIAAKHEAAIKPVMERAKALCATTESDDEGDEGDG